MSQKQNCTVLATVGQYNTNRRFLLSNENLDITPIVNNFLNNINSSNCTIQFVCPVDNNNCNTKSEHLCVFIITQANIDNDVPPPTTVDTVFTVSIVSTTGGNLPYSYKWTLDTSVAQLKSGTDLVHSTLQFQLKAPLPSFPHTFNNIWSLVLTDSLGCLASSNGALDINS
jgi:hypothetical protein